MVENVAGMTQCVAMELIVIQQNELHKEGLAVNITVAAVLGLGAEVTEGVLLRLAADATEYAVIVLAIATRCNA